MNLPSMFTSSHAQSSLSSKPDKEACRAAWRQGQARFQANSWVEAAESFLTALTAYTPEAGVKRVHIERNLRCCRLALHLWQLVQEGEQALADKEWNIAAQRFRRALALEGPEIGIDRSALALNLTLAENGYRFQNALNTAREAAANGIFHVAQQYYYMAIEMHEPDYGVDKDLLKQEQSAVRTQLKQPKPFFQRAQVWPTTLLLLLGIIGLLVTAIPSREDDELHTQIQAPESVPTANHWQTAMSMAPSFPEGERGLREYLRRNLRYPHQAQSMGISGQVTLRFRVLTDGSLENIEIMQGLGYGCGEEALRVVQAMPRWKPASQNGQAVETVQTLTISFEMS